MAMLARHPLSACPRELTRKAGAGEFSIGPILMAQICTRWRKAIRLIEDILVVSEQVCRASFPVRPDCDLEAPGIFVARLGNVKDHRARPLALRWALHQRKNASPRH